MFKNISWYFNVWIKENKSDALNRYETLKNYFKNYNFVINIVALIAFWAMCFVNPIFYGVLFIALSVFLIDVFLWRYIYLLNKTWLEKSTYSFLKSEGMEEVWDEDSRKNYENIDNIAWEYLEDKVTEKASWSLKSKALYYVNRYVNFHETLAKKIIHVLIFNIFKKVIPNTNFDNYLLKLIYYPYSILKAIAWLILGLIVYILKAILSKITDIFITILLTIITFGLYLVYLFFYKHIKRIISFLTFVVLKVVLIIKLIIKFYYIVIAAGIFYLSAQVWLDWLIYIELWIIGLSTLLILWSIANNFIGISPFKATPQFAISAGLWLLNPWLSTAYISVLSACENKESWESILNFIKWNYNANFYNTSLSKDVVKPINVWIPSLTKFTFLDTKPSERDVEIAKTQSKIDKTDKFINSANTLATGEAFKEENNTASPNNTLTNKPWVNWIEFEKVELSEEDKLELSKKQKELEIMKIEEEKEKLKRKKESREKLNKNFELVKNSIWESLTKASSFIKEHSPILLSKWKDISNQLVSKTKNISENIDTDSYKNIKLNNKHKNISILSLIIVIFLLWWYSSYERYYLHNNIIKVWDSITLKEKPVVIDYFNNRNLNIGVEDDNTILAQQLMSARVYEDRYGSPNYKVWGYSSFYDIGWNIDLEEKTIEEKERWVILKSENRWDLNVVTFNEDIDNHNLYDLELFKELNSFTNKNMFYSSIIDSERSYLWLESWLWNKITSIFSIDRVIWNINFKAWSYLVNAWETKSRLIWLELSENNLILQIKYNFTPSWNTISTENKIKLEDEVTEAASNIYEEDIISFSNIEVNNNKDNIEIKATYKISNSNIESLLSNTSLNDTQNIDHFIMNY